MKIVLLLSGLLVTAPVLWADMRCASIFGDHLVLQRERSVPIWGEASPGEQVTVEFAGQKKATAADASGHWRVALEPLPANAQPQNLIVHGKNTLTLVDVLVGEVWFCSGQSNMEKPLGPRAGQKPTTDYDVEIAAANHPLLRLFQVPRTDLKQSGPGVFHWLPCSPDALRTSNFSAAAYYFGRPLQETLGVPVGLIHSSFGGTYIDAWMPHEAFADSRLKALETRTYFAWVKGVQPTELFQSMAAPYAPYAIRGFLWYQGETNIMDGDVALYDVKQTALIATWRKAWEIPDAPFYGVLLPPFDYSKWEKFPVTDQALPLFREEQIDALSAPQTGFIVATDLVSDLHDIHPVNKRDIGLRLARLALNKTYGRADIVGTGPTYSAMKSSGGALELSFTNADGLRTRDGLAPTDFAIAGRDQIFHSAEAKIVQGKLVISSSEVPEPVAARFAWHETATPNLVNASGLPAVPFRTDAWPVQFSRPAAAPEKK